MQVVQPRIPPSGVLLDDAGALRAGPGPSTGMDQEPTEQRTLLVALLMLCSGASALMYQTAWLRDLKLIFGASTSATAAVLAIFMAGLGLGSVWLGSRVDRHPNPLRLYGLLEIGITLSAALSPILLVVVRYAYVGLGGSWSLGPIGGLLIRLALAAFVIGVPAFLMGGTLPAAARSVGSRADRGRRRLALLYGVNTLGAVLGVSLATFGFLEHLGTRGTIWIAAGLNATAALAALAAARWTVPLAPASGVLRLPRTKSRQGTLDRPIMPARFVYVAAGVVGFVFFLMEIVWYRMLSPLLGGTTYSFGLILGVALVGISLGSTLYALTAGRRPPTATRLAITCALEALAFAIPFACGDRLAILAVLLRPLGQFEFLGHVAAWTALTSIVVLPAATVAGYQFPLLVRLLGRGRKQIGSHAGRAYAWNTSGAILGSLAGGFGLLPWLTAPGVWRLASVALAALSVLVLVVSFVRRPRILPGAIAALVLALGAVLVVTTATGPTAAWRHSPIGAGRVDYQQLNTRNDVIEFVRSYRRATAWEREGRESSVALYDNAGLALIVGGKSDGNVIDDAGTQVMVGMLGALLHPAPHRALVIGLGTGSTSGWLGQVPSIERVDTVELEPAVVAVAERCSIANFNVLRNPKQRILIGDGREYLLTTRDTYDLICSEPSNPYRAGVASLFTREFYGAAASRLSGGGLFLQWIQAYDADFETLEIVYSTIRSVFSDVETWTTIEGDLLLVASQEPIVADVGTLRRKITEQPYRSALDRAWRTTSVEGLLARYVGNAEFAASIESEGPSILNTDDRTALEFRFARAVGTKAEVDMDGLRVLAMIRQQNRPQWTGLEELDGELVSAQKASMHLMESIAPPSAPPDSPIHFRIAAMRLYLADQFEAALSMWRRAGVRPSDLTELAMVADLLAEAGDPEALRFISQLGPYRSVEADFLTARLRLRLGDAAGATEAFVAACTTYRTDMWSWPRLAERSLPLAVEIAQTANHELGSRVYAALELPFAASCSNLDRLATRVEVARRLDGGKPGAHMLQAIDGLGPHFPWTRQLLFDRMSCFENLGDPRLESARRDVRQFLANQPRPLPFEAALAR